MNSHYAYCAGFFDGEGCVVIGKNGSLQLRIINTGRTPLQYIQNVLGGTIKDRKQKVNKKQYYWSAYGEEAEQILYTLLPYLIEKLDQVRVALKWMEEREVYAPIQNPHGKGRLSHPDREARIEHYRNVLTQQKLGTYIEQ